MANKMTQRDYYNEIKALATANDRQDIVDFVDGRIAALDRKAGSTKPTAKQVENEEFKVTIADILALSAEPKTVTEIIATGRLGDISNQRVSAILKQMVDAGTVVKTMDKKRALFSLPDAE